MFDPPLSLVRRFFAGRSLLWLVAMAVFMQMLDTTIVNTALPAMARDLGESPLRMQSVIISYALAVALLTPASGWLADRFGTRHLFAAAVLVFTVGSLLCGAAQTLQQLIAARVLQGVGGAMLLPVGRLAVLRSYPRDQFLSAMSFIVVPALIGPLIGPTLGGWLTQSLSWHWIFLVNIPVGIIGVVAALRLMPDFRAAIPGRFDGVGYVLLAVSMIGISIALDGLSNPERHGWLTALLLLVGAGAFVGYWLLARRNPDALFPLRLFDLATYRIGMFGNLFARAGSGAMPFMIPLVLQVGLGHSPLRAGTMMIPVAAAAMLSKTVVTPLVRRLGYRRVLSVNTVLVGMVMASFSLLTPGWPAWLHVLHFGVFGLLNSVQFTAMSSVTLQDLDAQLASAGNSLQSMVMIMSISIGVALASALLALFGHWFPTGEGATLPVFRATFICMGLLTSLSALVFMRLPDTVASPRAA